MDTLELFWRKRKKASRSTHYCVRKGLSFSRREFLALGALALFLGCEPRARTRPPSYVRIGSPAEFLQRGEFLEPAQLFLFHDEQGFAVMSTQCTHDLSPLKLVKNPQDGQLRFVSDYTSSTYSLTGEVLTGPAVTPLPYYKLELREGEYGGPLDTLYVMIGEEVPPSWRLPVVRVDEPTPTVLSTPASPP